MPDRLPLIVAHRGAWDTEPQNSLASMRRAEVLGADMIELDVRSTRDGRLVVVHEAVVGGERVNRLSLEELRVRLPATPALEEVLEQFGGRVRLDLEIKVAGIEAECLSLFQNCPLETLLVTSFHTGVLDTFRRRNPRLATGLVARKGDPNDLASHCRLAGHKALFLHHALLPGAGTLSPDLDLYGWTINGEADLTAALQRGDLAGVVTDDPALGLSLRAVTSFRV